MPSVMGIHFMTQVNYFHKCTGERVCTKMLRKRINSFCSCFTWDQAVEFRHS